LSSISSIHKSEVLRVYFLDECFPGAPLNVFFSQNDFLHKPGELASGWPNLDQLKRLSRRMKLNLLDERVNEEDIPQL